MIMRIITKIGILATTLVMLFLTASSAQPVYAYSSEYWDDLMRCLYYSELDYYEIWQRAIVLEAMPDRTPAQQYELDSYNQQLEHDKVVIARWITLLRDNNVGYQDSKIRDKYMGELAAIENARLAEVTDAKNEYAAYVEANYTLVDTVEETWARDDEGNPILDAEGNPILKTNEDGSPINFMMMDEYRDFVARSYDYYIDIYNMRLGYITTLKKMKSVWFK